MIKAILTSYRTKQRIADISIHAGCIPLAESTIVVNNRKYFVHVITHVFTENWSFSGDAHTLIIAVEAME